MQANKQGSGDKDKIIPGPSPEKLRFIEESRASEKIQTRRQLFVSGQFMELGKDFVSDGDKSTGALLFAQGFIEDFGPPVRAALPNMAPSSVEPVVTDYVAYDSPDAKADYEQILSTLRDPGQSEGDNNHTLKFKSYLNNPQDRVSKIKDLAKRTGVGVPEINKWMLKENRFEM